MPRTVDAIDLSKGFLAQEKQIGQAFDQVADAVTVALLSSHTSKKQPVAGSDTEGPVYGVKLNRWWWDTRGQQPDIERLCGQAGATQVRTRRSAGDAVVSFFTLGIYTPARARVACGAPS